MAKKRSKPVPRKSRTDAQRNRLRILAVAKEAFTRFGASASLDEIARQANVGPGTLYRHFPTRDLLIEAVYRSEVEKLAEAQRRFAETMTPMDALRNWMLLFVDHIAAKQIIAPALNSVVGGPSKMYASSLGLVREAMENLARRAVQNGDIRGDVESFDLLRVLIGVSYTASCPGWQESGRRLVDILLAGARPGK